MLPTISLGPLALPTAGLIYIIGAWITLSVIERSAKALKLQAEATYSLAAVSLVAGFMGARLVFVVLHWPAYRNNLTGIVWPLTSGFDLWGGTFFAIVAGFFYGRAKQLPLAPTLDALAPGILTGLICVSLADFFSGPGYGTESNLPWAINLYGITRHAVQIYEIIIALLALIFWWRASKRNHQAGQLFLMAMAVYAAGRLFVDAFRANSPLTANGFHIIQIASLVALLISVYLLGRMASDPMHQQEAAEKDP